MYNLQATLREITVLDLTSAIQEITVEVEVVDLPMFLDLSPSLTSTPIDDQLPPPPEVVYLDLDFEIDPFPDISPAALGLRIDNSILHA